MAWLEREGFDYDYYADAHLHDGTLNLSAYKLLIVPLHPEYWTREMYLRVKHWVHHEHGKLMYLGGNGLNCEVVLEGDTMRCLSHVNSFRYGLGGSRDENPEERYDSRMHRTLESEANLLGIASSDTGIMTAAPYRVLPLPTGFSRELILKSEIFSENKPCTNESQGVLPAMKQIRSRRIRQRTSSTLPRERTPEMAGPISSIIDTKTAVRFLGWLHDLDCGAILG